MQKELLTAKEVAERVGCDVSTIYARMKSGDFPRSIKIGSRSVRWWSREIDAWLQTRPRFGESDSR